MRAARKIKFIQRRIARDAARRVRGKQPTMEIIIDALSEACVKEFIQSGIVDRMLKASRRGDKAALKKLRKKGGGANLTIEELERARRVIRESADKEVAP